MESHVIGKGRIDVVVHNVWSCGVETEAAEERELIWNFSHGMAREYMRKQSLSLSLSLSHTHTHTLRLCSYFSCARVLARNCVPEPESSKV